MIEQMIELRPYQRRSADEVIRRLVVFGDNGTLLDLPTGTGKTVIFCSIARRWFEATGTRILILAHRKNLITQTRDKLISLGFFSDWQCGIEHGRNNTGRLQPVVLSVDQTMVRRLSRFKRGEFGLVIIDEAHRVRTATYERILNHFLAKRLGVTATPKRLDQKSLGSVFDSFAYRYKLNEAVSDGWLVPIRTKRIELKTAKFNGVGLRAGDYKRDRLSKILRRDETVEEIVSNILEHSGDRHTIIFTVDTRQTEAYFNKIEGLRPGSVRRSDSKVSAALNDRYLADFLSGRYQYLINCELYTEGTDLPNASCVAMARPTKSWSKYMQMLGRGTRLLGRDYPESIANGKEDVLILDFTDNSVSHSPLCVGDVLYDDLEKPREESERNTRQESDEMADIAVIEDQTALSLTAHARDIDIFNLNLFKTVKEERATALHVRELRALGFGKTKAEKLTESQAERVLIILRQRRRDGLASYRQALQLRRYRLDEHMPKREAQTVLGRIAAAGWPKPFSHEFLQLGIGAE